MTPPRVFGGLVRLSTLCHAFAIDVGRVTNGSAGQWLSGAMLGARRRERFWHIILPLLIPGLAITFCLSFVQAFAVFPSAVLLGAPAGSTHVISIAAYQAAFERYDASLGSAIAMVMGAVQFVVVLLALGARSFFYRGPVGGTKG